VLLQGQFPFNSPSLESRLDDASLLTSYSTRSSNNLYQGRTEFLVGIGYFLIPEIDEKWENGPFPRKFPVYLAVLRSNRPQKRSQEDETQKIKRTFTYRKTRRSSTGPTASPERIPSFRLVFPLQRTISWCNSRSRSRFPMNPLFPEILALGIRSCLATNPHPTQENKVRKNQKRLCFFRTFSKHDPYRLF